MRDLTESFSTSKMVNNSFIGLKVTSIMSSLYCKQTNGNAHLEELENQMLTEVGLN
jgi:hypothetical protein